MVRAAIQPTTNSVNPIPQPPEPEPEPPPPPEPLPEPAPDPPPTNPIPPPAPMRRTEQGRSKEPHAPTWRALVPLNRRADFDEVRAVGATSRWRSWTGFGELRDWSVA